ncbi:MAG: hypothetical protein ACYTFI_23520 [Planctomycetota bacterium]
MPASRQTREPSASARAAMIARPEASLAAAVDALAGYVIASPAVPGREDALAVVPLVFASAGLLAAAGNVFEHAFSSEREGRAPKGVFIAGAVLALGGLFAAMGAALSAGAAPVYLAAFLFLVTWARAGRASAAARAGASGLPVAGPVLGGTVRALALALGMSAHSEVVYLTAPGPAIAAGVFFAYGALVECIERTIGEGGKRYLLVGALAGCLAVFGVSGVLLARTALSRFVAVVGAVFVASRGAPAVRSLLPADIRRFGEGALLAGFLLDSALCLGYWEATDPAFVFAGWAANGTVLALGSLAVALFAHNWLMLARSGRT